MADSPRTDADTDIASWRRALAYWWYIWGLSWCYWGIRTAEQWFFRGGIRSFDRAIRIWPGFAGGFYRRGLIRGRELSQHQQAIEDLSRAIELDPEWPEPYLQRGLFQRFLDLGGDRAWRGEAERQIAMLRADLDEREGPEEGQQPSPASHPR